MTKHFVVKEAAGNTRDLCKFLSLRPQTDRLPLLSGTRSIVPSQIHMNLAETRLVVLSTNLLVLLRRLLTGSGDLGDGGGDGGRIAMVKLVIKMKLEM